MTITADPIGRITLRLDQLRGIELVFDSFPDRFVIAAWCCAETGVVNGLVPVGEA